MEFEIFSVLNRILPKHHKPELHTERQRLKMRRLIIQARQKNISRTYDKSTSDFLIYYGNTLISCNTTTQRCVATSSAEAELYEIIELPR